MRITRLDTARCKGGENPLWDADAQALYFVDNFGQKVHRFHPASGKTKTWEMPSVVTTFALRQSGGGVVTLWTGIYSLDFEAGDVKQLAPMPDKVVFNDGKIDRRGRFVIGASTNNFEKPTTDGGVFSFDADHRLTRIDSDVHFSNSPCWSPDGKTFYFSDSYRNTTYAYDYDIATGKLANKRVFVNTTDLGGVPDGATVDTDGLVWIAIFRGSKVVAFRPDGKVERIVDMPVPMTSSVAFGGPNMDQLYVTTIEEDATAKAQGKAEAPGAKDGGYVFVIDGLGSRGAPEHRYAG